VREKKQEKVAFGGIHGGDTQGGFNLAGIRRTRDECKKVLEYRRQTFGELSTVGIRLADDGSGCSTGELNSEGCHEGCN